MDYQLRAGYSDAIDKGFFTLHVGFNIYMWEDLGFEGFPRWCRWPSHWKTYPTEPCDSLTFLIMTGKKLEETIERDIL